MTPSRLINFWDLDPFRERVVFRKLWKIDLSFRIRWRLITVYDVSIWRRKWMCFGKAANKGSYFHNRVLRSRPLCVFSVHLLYSKKYIHFFSHYLVGKAVMFNVWHASQLQDSNVIRLELIPTWHATRIQLLCNERSKLFFSNCTI